MTPEKTIAEKLRELVRGTDRPSQLDAAIKEIYSAHVGGKITSEETEQLERGAIRHRGRFKTAAFGSPNRPSVGHPRPAFGKSLQRLASAASMPIYCRAPSWIGGKKVLLTHDEARRLFQRRRNRWREQLRYDKRPSKTELRIAMEIHDGLNSNPGHEWFGLCFLSIKKFSVRLGCRQESVISAMRQLEALGHLRVFHGKGKGNPNRYEPIIRDSAEAPVECSDA
ncbi:MAG: hypothetical protein E7774_10100 [Bradyrhizobium sp.]|nr:MAG: hypothetical protein E7774_10100 [Bradyrhizobium sp.]